MSNAKVKLNAMQVEALQDWLKEKQVPAGCPVVITQTETGIGPAIEAQVEITEGEGIWKDLTNYNDW